MQNGDDGKDEFENDEEETLATVIDKILAWEKKLYDEVKVTFFWLLLIWSFMFWSSFELSLWCFTETTNGS